MVNILKKRVTVADKQLFCSNIEIYIKGNPFTIFFRFHLFKENYLNAWMDPNLTKRNKQYYRYSQKNNATQVLHNSCM